MNKKLETITVDLDTEAHAPTFVVCYGRSTTFRVEGRQATVDQGSRSVVHRSLCVSRPYGDERCGLCPQRIFTISLEARGAT